MIWLRGLAWIVVISIVLLITMVNTGRFRILHSIADLVPGDDATGHFVLTGLMGLAVYAILGGVRFRGRRVGVFGTFLLVAALAGSEEASQLWLPRRQADWGDLLLGYLGLGSAMIGLIAGRRFWAHRRMPRRD